MVPLRPPRPPQRSQTPPQNQETPATSQNSQKPMLRGPECKQPLAEAWAGGVTPWRKQFNIVWCGVGEPFCGPGCAAENHGGVRSRAMTREPLVIRNPGYRRHGSNHKKSRPCFVTKSVRFGRTELLFFFPCSKSRDLQSEHGLRACSFKDMGKELDFHTSCDQQN